MGQRSIVIAVILVIVALILGVVFVIRGIFFSPNVQKSTAPVSVATTVSVANALKDPIVYDGLTVDVNSSVSDWVTKRVFTLRDGNAGGLFGVSNTGQLIVIADKNFSLNKKTNDPNLGLGETVKVHVKGRIRIMNKLELSQAMGIDLDKGDIKLDDNNLSSWKEGSVLILESVEKL